jgi:excisionase family DNA binding protein
MSSEYLTTEEAAAHLRVSVETIRRWCRQGKLATVRFGRAHRIPLRAILALDPEHASTETPADESAEAPTRSEPQSDDADDGDATVTFGDATEGEVLSPGWTRAELPDAPERAVRPRPRIIE